MAGPSKKRAAPPRGAPGVVSECADLSGRRGSAGRPAYLGPIGISLLEDVGQYNALSDAMLASIQPRDELERIYAEDIIQETFNVIRYRGARRASLALATREAIANVMARLKNSQELDVALALDKASGWECDLPTLSGLAIAFAAMVMRKEPRAIAAYRETLSDMGLTDADTSNLAVREALPELAKIDLLIDAALGRRDRTFRELDRRRDNLASRLRAAANVAEAEDAEFYDLPDLGWNEAEVSGDDDGCPP